MNEGKRKIGEYTVLCSVNVGEKEVILASNEQSTNGDKFMCGFAERNDLFELCSECMVNGVAPCQQNNQHAQQGKSHN